SNRDWSSDVCSSDLTLSSLLELLVTGLLKIACKLCAAGLDDLAVRENVYVVRDNVVEDALVVGNHDDATVGFLLVGVDSIGNNAQRVNVKTGVGLVHDSELWLDEVQLHALLTLLLAAGETFVNRAGDEGLVNVQTLTSFLKLVVPLTQLRCFAANSGNS